MREEVRNAGIVLAAAIATLFALFMLGGLVHAGQPECTGDRHLDECGQYCPVTTTVTTTLPPTIEGCNPGCIYPEQCGGCPDVVCGSAGGAIVNVTVNKCAPVPAPSVYQFCFTLRPEQHLNPHDKTRTYQGVTYVCPKRTKQHRYLVPVA